MMHNQICCRFSKPEVENISFAEYVGSLLDMPLSMQQPSDLGKGEIAPFTLIVSKPRRPLRHLLLVVRNSKSDEAAALCTLRLAQASSAGVTVLPVIPLPPNFLRLSDDLQTVLTILLNSDAPLGVFLYRLVRQLRELRIHHKMKLYRGTPEWQVAQALEAGDHELVITGAENGRLSRWLVGEFVSSLPYWLDCPLLIVKPQKEGSVKAYERFSRN